MLILNFTYPLRCLRVPPVEYHCLRPQNDILVNKMAAYFAKSHLIRAASRSGSSRDTDLQSLDTWFQRRFINYTVHMTL
jgi:hypothetical protein